MSGSLKRALALFLALALSLTLAAPAAAAESAAAVSMQLMRTEGTVDIADSRGKSVSIFEKMRLYNGYRVTTGEASYAWINLDSAKLVKEDASSEIQIQKSGKKLDILVNSGNLFFNVTEPLETDESLTIRTATMAVGVRGTCGWVRVIDQWRSELYVLEGVATVSVRDPVTGQLKTEPVTGGETVECVVYPQDREGDKCDILRRRYKEEEIHGFVLVDLAEDEGLCRKIYDDSGLDILGWLKGGSGSPAAASQERLQADQAALAEQWAAIREQLAGQAHHVSKDPVWKEESAKPEPVRDDIPAQTGPAAPAPGGTAPAPADPPASSDLTMKATDDQVMEALAQSDSVTVLSNADPSQNTLDVDSGITVPAGQTLTLQNGIDVAVQSGQLLQVDGTMNINGALANSGTVSVTSSNTLRVNGTLQSNAAMFVSATGRVVVDGVFVQGGSLTPAPGAVIQAKSIVLAFDVPGWRVSDAPDAGGYYTLVPDEEQEDDGPAAVSVSGTVSNIRGEPVADARITVQQGGADLAAFTTDGNGAYGGGVSLERGDWVILAEADGFNSVMASGSFPDSGALQQDFALESSSWDWRYDSGTKTLYILGSGPMDDFVSGTPWEAFTEDITDVQITGVTSIGERAFRDCGNLTGVEIPDSVTGIESGAFKGCASLTVIVIPDAVTSIGEQAFEGCVGLTAVTIPDSVTSISDRMFASCTGLNSVTLPGNLTSIGPSAFLDCSSLTTINFGGTQAQWENLISGVSVPGGVSVICSDGTITPP